ncbi:hypothetical protein MBM_05935 [Drepanopeziza brunnea f. sp. 'multigermtubi' MB_m1]|uniref:FAM192A/Fyv6 N-terminal domain-containing protein n=1 Tax=Marssonina brunnea f. sp. multigermtubi (strain MB_m1) TaxID=1072389 RepID=K1XTM3_MARBU|nr:uncharacterized protein MBM_05935 [Drepanopeziza brunnea f. sp. 'multigermtubi' MB_m1]EKD15924.1 hypothetical protein MBM_05935 [Drepanopeziza brunnea f. sp. 'multigermtubi' MB_m1]
MSSGFISGGTSEAPLERSDEWLAAQKEIEANALRRAELARQQDGKSLFETLEANKGILSLPDRPGALNVIAAKQEAFEEANRLKNQFRGVDEDEAEWLDSVLESTRAEEDRIKRETAEGLALFRQQQEEEDKKARRSSDGLAAEEVAPIVEEGSWATGKKRKRTKDKEGLKGVKLRRASASAGIKEEPKPENPVVQSKGVQKPAESAPAPAVDTKKSPDPPKVKTGLVSYGSDEDDDW